MNRKRILIALAAALCLVLGACGAQEEQAPAQAALSAEAAVLAEETVPDRASIGAEPSAGIVSQVDLPGVYLEDTELAVVDAINAEREALGLGKLTVNEKLTQAARVRSEELCRTDHWDHTRPNGDSWSTVLKEDVPFSFTAAGENLATVTYNDRNKHYEADADWWFMEWKNSPTHYENMIREEFNEVGVGIYFEERDDGVKVAYATTLFAKTELQK